MFEFWKNEWQLFLDDLSSLKNGFMKIFGIKKDDTLMLNASLEEFASNEEEAQKDAEPVSMSEVMPEVKYEEDAIDNKVTAYFGEDINSLRENVSGEKTQHEVLREYAQFFKPYNAEYEMCNSAFQKYYDRHALKIATNEISVEQLRIVQNNVDIFISGQEVFGDLIKPIKTVLEDKLNEVHNSLRNHEDWNEEYQQLLSDERKYLYALNRIEQYETEQRISEFEQKLSEIDVNA